jgi:hypothetical protein
MAYDVEKNIAFKIEQQFPAIYREEQNELVSLVTDYYKFMETQSNQAVYNSRRMFEYRDITTTLQSMIIFFQKKYLVDLPLLDDSSVRLLVKNILALYRRKGSENGITLFFRMFYQEDIQIYNPSNNIFKPSDSNWRTGEFLQLIPNSGTFYARDGVTYYNYGDLLNKNIVGSTSHAKAAVDKINLILLNNTLTPIIYINQVKGKFQRYDDVVARINGQDVSFGIVNGSASGVEIDLNYGGTTGNSIGDILNITSTYGKGATCIVTDTEDEFTGIVNYTLEDGGFGYTIENTRLLVSNQSLILQNPNSIFVELEYLEDNFGNRGKVIGQNASSVGLLMDVGDEFVQNSIINTVDRTSNITINNILKIAAKNDSSPGLLYPDTGDVNDVKVEVLSNSQTISLITDVISGFLSVPLNSANFNTVPPATAPMSGTANPVTLATPLNSAFDLTPFTIGSIGSFENINPGSDYINDVFTLVRDETMISFERYEQVIIVDNFSALFSVGDPISQASSGVNGIITSINPDNSFITVRPYAYYGFDETDIVHKGTTYDIISTERDYGSNQYGKNAKMISKTLFATGRVSEVKILNSGFGYINGETVFLTDDDGNIVAKGTMTADAQGISAGFWGGETSHLNGYKTDGTYYDSRNKLHDSDFYQEYSYEIRSTVDIETYRDTLKQNVHLAGTRLFGKFTYNKKSVVGVSARMFVAKKEDPLIGGDPIVGPNQPGIEGVIVYSADRNTISVDSTNLRVDTAG